MRRPGRPALLILLFAALPVLLAPALCAAQDDRLDEVEHALAPRQGEWRRNFASPSVGLVLYKVKVRQEFISYVIPSLDFGEKEYTAPAVEIRIARGRNITKRAGFFYGYEAGAVILIPDSRSFSHDLTIEDPDGTFSTGPFDFRTTLHGGSVFLMAKYGYRFELGASKLGFSAGIQLGTGAGLFSGGYDVYVGSRDNPSAESGRETGETRLDIATDISIEAALRLGRNFRLFAAAGMLVTPVEMGEFDNSNLPGSEIIGDGVYNSLNEYLDYALNTYEVDIDGFGFSMRAGFSLNFD